MMMRSEMQGCRAVVHRTTKRQRWWRVRATDLCMAAMLALPLLGLSQADAAQAAEGERVWRWMPPFHVQVPANWRPRMDDGGVGYYSARHPEAKTEDIPEGMSEEDFSRLPFGMVHVGRERPPKRGGTLDDILGQFKKMGEDEKVSNFSLTQEDAMLGSRPAVLLRVGGDQQVREGLSVRLDSTMMIAREPDADGMFQAAMLAGTSTFFDAHTAAIKAMLAEAVEDRQPPLRPLREITYLVDGDKLKYTFGPAVAPDGAVALGDWKHARVLVFAADGSVMHEWGSKHAYNEPSPPDAFKQGKGLAFGPEGRVYLVDGGYGDPVIRIFERDGRPVAAHALDRKTLPERGLKEIRSLWVGPAGELWLTGQRASDDALVLMTLSAAGEILTEIALPQHHAAARMPDGGVVLGVDGDRADRIVRLDAQGQQIAEWTYTGTGFDPLPGESRQYFSIEHLATDGIGRVYVFDDAEDGFWIYSAEGVFQEVVPEQGLVNNRFAALVASARGDLLVQDEPGLGSGDAPALRWLENASPAAIGAPIPAAAAVAAPAADKRAPELVALAAQGNLTVRALRGFGQLEPKHDALALQLRAQSLDLYAADAVGIEAWLVAHAGGKQALPEGSIETLQLLALKLREFEPRAPETSAGVCVCVDTRGNGQHTVMKHGSGAPQQVRLQAGDINACMKLIETLPECSRQP